tara:strand:+ start:34 stop:456 length:423 start_codon:yes stop_codon:yes gene_type:complete
MAKKNISRIELLVELDENKIPEKIYWTAKDGDISNKETKAALLSLWDSESRESLRIDLWTKDMPIDDMKMFFYQTLSTMTDTYQRATQDEEMTKSMKDFCNFFAERLNYQISSYHSFILLPSSLIKINKRRVKAIKLDPP